MLVDNKEYVPIENTIKITTRYVQNNENIGFGVQLGNGSTAKFTYENTIKMCDLFRPLNFVIRYGKENKRFIAGKAGCPLSELPVEVIGSTTDAKRVKPTTKDKGKVTGDFVQEIDIMDLYSFVNKVNGFIINLPNTEYKATTQSSAVAKEFIPFNIGEIGVPYLDFNETKMNVSCNFKKPGAVAIELKPGKMTNVISFVYRRKNVFFNGDNYIKRLGIVINPSDEQALLNTFGKSMSLTEITDVSMIGPISMLIGQQGMKFYEVDTSKIGLIAKSKLNTMILSGNTLFEKVLRLNQNKLITKYLNGMLKEIKEVTGDVSGDKINDIAPQFAAMSTNELEKLEANGIDIYSGAYTVKDDTVKSKGIPGDDTVEIAYAIEGLNPSSLTYKQMVAGGDKVPNFLSTVISRFNSISNIGERAVKAREMVTELEKSSNEIKRELWMHKCAMYIMSNKSGVHSHDKKYWELNTKKRTKAKCYNCKLKGCEKLQLLVSNIDIK